MLKVIELMVQLFMLIIFASVSLFSLPFTLLALREGKEKRTAPPRRPPSASATSMRRSSGGALPWLPGLPLRWIWRRLT